MPLDFSEFLDVMDESPFQEIPVDLQTFLYSKEFLKLPKLSELQEKIVEIGSEIYNEPELIAIHGFDEGTKRWRNIKNKIVSALGKGTISGDAKIWTDRGLITIKELMPGDMVETWSGKSVLRGAYVREPIQIYEVTTKYGFKTRVAMRHEIMSCKKNDAYDGFWNQNKTKTNQIKFHALEDLSVGDYIPINIGWQNLNDAKGPGMDEARLLGYMAGDGTYCRISIKNPKYKPSLRNPEFTNNTPEVMNDVKDIVVKLGGNYKEYRSGKGCPKIRINALTPWFKENNLVQEYGTTKSFDWNIFNWSEAEQIEWIKGLLATDGWITHQSRKDCKVWTVGVAINSPELAEGIHLLLAKLGVLSQYSVKKLKNENHKDVHNVWISNKASLRTFIKLITNIPGKNAQLNNMKNYLENCVDGDRQIKLYDGRFYMDSIKSIEYVGEEIYWDLSVDVECNYMADGMTHLNSGKDLLSVITCLRIIYQLMCLKDPAEYFGKPSGDAIDLVNMSVNARSAQMIFFKSFKTRLKACPWFHGKYKERAVDVEFDKGITMHSLNSETSGQEGGNIFCAVLDELDEFAEADAEKLYRAARASVTSRFPKNGKLIILSFPRSKESIVTKIYDEFVAEKITNSYSYTFKLNDNLPDGLQENEFSIEWHEDDIISYKYSDTWCIRRPSWKANPTKNIEDYKMDFYSDPTDSLGRFAADPQDTSGDNQWYKDKARIDAVFNHPNGVDLDGSIRIKPIEGKQYYIHTDLALVQDNAAVAMSHIDSYKAFMVGQKMLDPQPHVVVDLVRFWKPGRERALDFSDIKQFIISLRSLGFNIVKVTFDRWNSAAIINDLNAIGINAEKLSVGRDHYNDLALAMGESRIVGPDSELLKKELKTLIVDEKGKIDHPGRTGNDLSDAVCGSVYNAVALTPRPPAAVEIVDWGDVMRENRAKQKKSQFVDRDAPGAIPADLEAFFESIRLL